VKIETSKSGSDILNVFAQSINSKAENGRVEISPTFGKGYVYAIQLNAHLRMIIRNYELYDDVVVAAQPGSAHGDMLAFNFRNAIKEPKLENRGPFELPSVQITTQGINGELYIPSHTKHRSIIVAANASYIRDLISSHTSSTVLRTITENAQALLYEHLISSSLQKVIQEIITASVPDDFANLFYRIKAEELLCYLFMELVKREEMPIQALNVKDIKGIYGIRDKLIYNLHHPPAIPHLAKYAGMSESKLRRVFKQVFGKSIFEYYQSFRMQQAAQLLREEKLSVTETGYRLGFTNMSHFSKTFEVYIGVKPKKYSQL
jgi:AraC-like DNA-binding protein